MSRGRPRIPAEDRFWAKVNKNTGTECWFWTGYKTTKGYGQLQTINKIILAHRYSYELHYGKIPDGLVVMHSCDQPSCVNPFHLSIGTHADNTRDKLNKNRQLRGSSHPRSKLTEDQVKEIREKLNLGITHKDISKDYGISRQGITSIKSGKNWTHI